jgi:hypothetical protein
MMYLDKKNNNRYIIRTTAVATIFTLAIMIAAASSMMATPTSATATTTTEEATTTATTPPEGIELSPQPVLRERQITISQTPINQTHILFTDSGNGTITLPNTTEAINFTGTDSVVVSIVDGTAVGKEVFTTVDGSETVNGTVFAMARFNMEEGTGRAIVTLLLQTNSTGRLAPVNGMILAGHIEFYPDGSAESTMWEWQGSGIPLPTATTTAATTAIPTPEIELSPQPIYQDQVRGISETLVNETYTLSTVSGNGTLTLLANGTETTIRTTSNGNIIVFDKFILPIKGTTTAIATGKQIITTEEDGSEENASATLYEIAQFNLQDYTGKGITIAVIHTNSTGMLAPLDGMIVVGQEEFRADGSRLVTMWEWQSGIPLPPPSTTTNATTSASGGGNSTDDFLSARGDGGAIGGGVDTEQ